MNAAITALVTLFFTLGTNIVRTTETVSAHNADIQRILDVLCEIKPQARACSKMDGAAGRIASR